MRTAVALSGGIDSLASLVILREAGHDLLPFHAVFLSHRSSDNGTAEKLEQICQKLKLPFHVLDLTQEFENLIIKPFISSYLNGLTPNPCALCNRWIKFGLVLEKVRSMGANTMATGHYAGICRDHSGTSLWRALDHTRDQSYFLSLVQAEAFQQVLFPLHDVSKQQAIQIMRQRSIVPPVKKESREVCFVPGDYREFLAGTVQDRDLFRPGSILNLQGLEIGKHRGLWRYTQGQRKGLGIAYEHPLYVLAKDARTNTLLAGSKDELLTRTCQAGSMNFLVNPGSWPDRVLVQTRYRQRPGEAWVSIQGKTMQVLFFKPLEKPAPGQVAAVYSPEGQVLGAGTIKNNEKKPLIIE